MADKNDVVDALIGVGGGVIFVNEFNSFSELFLAQPNLNAQAFVLSLVAFGAFIVWRVIRKRVL